MHKRKHYYEILDIPMSADLKTIHAAYLKKAREFHPSKASLESKISALAGAKIAELIEAYQVLRDENRRREYDRWIRRNDGPSQLDLENRLSKSNGNLDEELSREELNEIMSSVLMKIREQIKGIEESLIWSDIGLVDAGLVLECHRDADHFIIQLLAVDVLRVKDLEKVVTKSVFDLPTKVENGVTNYLLSLVVCIGVQSDELIKAYVFNFNRSTLKRKHDRDIIMMAVLSLKDRELYFPFINSFKPDFLAMKLPKGYKVRCS